MGVPGDVIVLWAASDSPDGCVWLANAPPGVRVMLVAPASLAKAVPAALARGPVVAVVGSDRDAHRALALGVDEVVRANAASAEALSAASESARLRSIGRDARPASPDGDSKAIELLAASVSCRVANPLAVASLNVEILRAAMGAVTGLADAYAYNAAHSDEPRDSEAQRIVALRASAPASAELQASMNDLALALHEASTAVAHVSSLVAPDEVDGACDIATVVGEVAQLVRIVVERVAELRVELPRDDACPARLPRSILVQALSALLTNALHAVRDRADRRVITVRVESRVAVGIIEVIDNGLGLGATALERVLDPPPSSRGAGTTAPGLSTVADRVRRAGGEIMFESEPGLGTTVRLFVPLLLRNEKPDLTSN